MHTEKGQKDEEGDGKTARWHTTRIHKLLFVLNVYMRALRQMCRSLIAEMLENKHGWRACVCAVGLLNEYEEEKQRE